MKGLEGRWCPSGVVSIAAITPSVAEGDPGGAMVSMSGTVSGSVTANWETVPGSATAGSDYTPASGTVELSESMNFASIYVGTLADSVADPDETFSIVITSITGDASLGSSSADITIEDGAPGGGGCGEPTSISISSPGTLNEGDYFELHGIASPPGMYTISGSVNWGNSPGMGSEWFSVMTTSDGHFSLLPHQYWDDGESPGNGTASDNETITLTAGSLLATTTATLANVAPTGSGFQLTDASMMGAPTWRLEGYMQDALPHSDVLDVTIDWGDGSAPTELNGLPPTSSVFQEHTFPMFGGTFTVQVTVSDDDLGQWLWTGNVETVRIDVITWEEIIVNDDDDNDDGIRDLSPEQSPVEGEDELFPVIVTIVNPAGIDLTGYEVQFTTLGPISLWQSLDKSAPVLSSSLYPVEALPSVFVEGLQEGGATIFVQLHKPSGGTASSKYRDLFVARTRLLRDGADVDLLSQPTVWVGERIALSMQGGPIASVEWTRISSISSGGRLGLLRSRERGMVLSVGAQGASWFSLVRRE